MENLENYSPSPEDYKEASELVKSFAGGKILEQDIFEKVTEKGKNFGLALYEVVGDFLDYLSGADSGGAPEQTIHI